MIEKPQDKGLRTVMEHPVPFKLSSNFTFQTMRKLEEAVRLREKRRERRTLVATILASVFLIGCCTVGLGLYWATDVQDFFTSFSALAEEIKIPSSCFLLLLVFFFFLCLDRWMRKAYYKLKSNQ